MAAVNRKYIGNNVYLSVYTRQQQNFKGYVFGAGQHDHTTAETVSRERSKVKDR
jgi:hypothetical protein